MNLKLSKRTTILAITLFVLSGSATPSMEHPNLEWPKLNTFSKPVHKIIIESILGREGQAYNGGKYKGNFFIIQGCESLNNKNEKLIADLPELRNLMAQGHRIDIFPVASSQRVAQFSKQAYYKIAVDGLERNYQFILGNKSKFNDFLSFQIQAPLAGNIPNLQPIDGQVHVNNDRIEGIGTVHLGHGARPEGRRLGNGVSSTEISRMIANNNNNPVLNEAFSMIEASDYANAHDRKQLLEAIQGVSQANISVNDVINLMQQDLDLVKKAQNKVNQSPRNYTTPFKDQLKEIVNFKGLKHAMTLLQRNPELLNGQIPQNLVYASGGKSLTLRTALLYVALAKHKAVHQDFSGVAANLASFYPGKMPGNAAVSRLLKKTNLYYNGLFLSPANGYVKNADRGINPNVSMRGLNLINEPGHPLNHPEMIFTDCSGFITNVLRRLNPSNTWLANNRFMSNHLAAAYDRLANAYHGTRYGLYDIHGQRVRSLTDHERGQLNNRDRVPHITQLFTPVMNPMQNIKPGDVIVTRHPNGSVEGHVMIVVEQNPRNPDEVTIVEMTRADVGGSRHGYNWRKISLSNPGNGKFCRVLRMKQE